ncbi:MAG TPA: hypothetical protein VJ302_09580 [Blastocatellia bacterium]|nr:hypothetical protein [Blastocatellia bacterium]
MSTARFEAFLARIYVDAEARAKFLADPRGEAHRAGLAESEVSALERIDRVGLELAARSIEGKRSRAGRRDLRRPRFLDRLRRIKRLSAVFRVFRAFRG